MSKKSKYVHGKVTVIISNHGPLVHAQEAPSYRTVTIQLTEEQIEKLKLNFAYSIDGRDCFENIERAIIEPEFKE